MPRLSIFALGAAAALSLLQGVSGHYQLLYPQSRGFSEDTEPTAPCGGFNQVLAQRAEFPLHGGFLEINSEHTQYAYQIKLALGNNPDSNAFANASTVGGGQRNYPLQSCLSVDLSNVTQATDGTNATFQIMYNAGDSILYQCTDVVLMNNPTNFNSSACVNANGSSSTGNSTSTSGSNALSVASGLAMTAMAGLAVLLA